MLMKRIKRDTEELARLEDVPQAVSSATSSRAFRVSATSSRGSVFSRLGGRSTSGASLTSSQGGTSSAPGAVNHREPTPFVRRGPPSAPGAVYHHERVPITRQPSAHTAVKAPGPLRQVADPRWTPTSTSETTPLQPPPKVVRSSVTKRKTSWRDNPLRHRDKATDNVDYREKVIKHKDMAND